MTKLTELESGALKHKEDKLRLDLVPIDVLAMVAGPLTVGLMKGYPEHNWYKGIDYMSSYAAAMRHIGAWFNGEDMNVERLPDGQLVGVPHLHCAIFNLVSIALQQAKNRHDLDNRWIMPKSEEVKDESQ